MNHPRSLLDWRQGVLLALVVLSANLGGAAELQDDAAEPPAPPNKRSIVVILDCSAHMGAATFDRGGQAMTRLDVSRNITKRLFARVFRNSRISVYLSGHRAGWQQDPNQPREVVYLDKPARPIPMNLQPYEDIEQIFKLGHPSVAQWKTLYATMDTARPWGERPLYLAIRDSLGEVAGGPDEASIVAITCGPNNVHQPTREKLVTKDLLIEALKKQRVPVHFLGYEMRDNERPMATAEFQEISQKSGGKSFDARDAAQLENHLLWLYPPEK